MPSTDPEMQPSVEQAVDDSSPECLTECVLIMHIRWALVLSKLHLMWSKVQDDPPTEAAIAEYMENILNLPLDDIFRLERPSAYMAVKIIKTIGEQRWTDIFEGGARRTLVPSVYQCRQFYGLDAPNNAAIRFKQIVQRIVLGRQDDPRRRSMGGTYDDRIWSWGQYAFTLVNTTGPRVFFADVGKLADLTDYFPGRNQHCSASDEHSFIRRVLALYDNLYLQILAPPVALVWQLWALTCDQGKQLLRDMHSNQQGGRGRIYVGPALPKSLPYFDVLTHIGDLPSSLPYPFGIAAKSVEDATADTDDMQPWTSTAVNSVQNALKADPWSPPILFAVRADQFPERYVESSKAPVPYITLTRPCDTFASVFLQQSTTCPYALARLSIMCETDGWGDAAIRTVPAGALNPSLIKRLTRVQMLTDFLNSDADVILTHFPVDIALRLNAQFAQVHRQDIYRCFSEPSSRSLDYTLSAAVLGGGFALASQPGMQSLLVAAAICFHKLHAFILDLAPSIAQEATTDETGKDLPSHSTDSLRKLAGRYEDMASGAAAKSVLGQAGLASDTTLVDLVKAIGIAMVNTLFEPTTAPANFKNTYKQAVNEWAWLLFLHYIDFTDISLSIEVMTGGRT